jgi:pseudaminic acid synthase
MIGYELVKKNKTHASIILEMRNDEEVRNMSFNSNLKNFDDFYKDFLENYFLHINPIFIKKNNNIIGYIGFTKENNKFYFNIIIHEHYRRKRLGSNALLISLRYIKDNYSNIKELYAIVKCDNLTSNKLFSRYFILIEKKLKNNYSCYFYKYNMENLEVTINKTLIGKNYPTYIIAELSCNHNQDKSVALKLINEAHKAGANAIKLQTYTPDTITLKCDRPEFTECLVGSIWEGQTLYDLYSKAYTPWEWHKELKDHANSLGMDLFSSPFDTTAVDFLESLDVPAYKIASFEITDHVLIKKIAQTGKPVIISSGMASKGELEEAVNLLRENGTTQICMLKCTSAYPAKPEDANLSTIKNMIESFNVVCGLSDHTLGVEVPIASVCVGARVIEKHFTLSRDSGSADDAFSLTPPEFKQMVDSVRIVEKTLGRVTFGGVKKEQQSKNYRRSLFAVKDIKKGDVFSSENVRSIRPSHGLHTKYYEDIIGKTAREDIIYGTPLTWNLIN